MMGPLSPITIDGSIVNLLKFHMAPIHMKCMLSVFYCQPHRKHPKMLPNTIRILDNMYNNHGS